MMPIIIAAQTTTHQFITAAATAILLFNSEYYGCDAHGYLKSPRSRNYYASINPIWSGGTAIDPAPENCPHCLNIGGTEARCGKVGEHNYDYPPNAIGGILQPIIQACYEEGSIIDIESLLTAYHKGHFEVKACAINHPEVVATQECFDAHPLTFVEDKLYGAPVDPLYPGRAYLPSSDVAKLTQGPGGYYHFYHLFKLPDGLRGNLVLLQWYYLTANSCVAEGYDTYSWPERFDHGSVPICESISPDRRGGVPEQFWNCAEVAIKVGNGCDDDDDDDDGASETSESLAAAASLPTSTPSSSLPTSYSTSDASLFPSMTTTATTTASTTATINAIASSSTTSSSSVTGKLVLNDSPRCGTSELDAREQCKPTCATDSDCENGEYCWNVHNNYCGSISKRVYDTPIQSAVISRCGVSEDMARTFCGEPCSWQCSKPGETCIAVHSNYCDSPYTDVGDTLMTAVLASTETPTTSNASNLPTPLPTLKPIAKPIAHNLPPPSSAAAAVEAVLEAKKNDIDNEILVYQEPSMQWVPSTIYRYKDLLDGLRVMYNDGVANKYFFMGDASANGHLYGLVNIAAFLAQSMKETIRYNACDENSWDMVNGHYPVANACGQISQSYQDYKCSESEAHMECEVKADMEIKATTNAKWYGAPAPLYCGPKTKYPFTGFWDHMKECDMPWNDPPEHCDDYQGQRAGGFDNSSPFPSSSGRTDVEGCCFWGRGVIQTTGVCNFGKLNYYLGKRAHDEGRDSRFPNINFCETPDAICASEEHKELKWIAGMFYWVESVQSYNVDGWDYITELKKFVDGGMSGNSFIDAISGIVNRGCHNPPCMTGNVDGREDRAANFQKVLTVLDLVA